jgi:hypothetical protein
MRLMVMRMLVVMSMIMGMHMLRGVLMLMRMSMIVRMTMRMQMRVSMLSILLLFSHFHRLGLPLLTLIQIGHRRSLRPIASTCRTHHITSMCLIFNC